MCTHDWRFPLPETKAREKTHFARKSSLPPGIEPVNWPLDGYGDTTRPPGRPVCLRTQTRILILPVFESSSMCRRPLVRFFISTWFAAIPPVMSLFKVVVVSLSWGQKSPRAFLASLHQSTPAPFGIRFRRSAGFLLRCFLWKYLFQVVTAVTSKTIANKNCPLYTKNRYPCTWRQVPHPLGQLFKTRFLRDTNGDTYKRYPKGALGKIFSMVPRWKHPPSPLLRWWTGKKTKCRSNFEIFIQSTWSSFWSGRHFYRHKFLNAIAIPHPLGAVINLVVSIIHHFVRRIEISYIIGVRQNTNEKQN